MLNRLVFGRFGITPADVHVCVCTRVLLPALNAIARIRDDSRLLEHVNLIFTDGAHACARARDRQSAGEMKYYRGGKTQPAKRVTPTQLVMSSLAGD